MRRFILLACVLFGLMIVLGLGDLMIVSPYRVGAERIATLQFELEAVTTRIEDTKRRLAAAKTAEPIDISKLGTLGADNAAALATLQERVRRAVAVHGGQALSTVGSVADADGLSRLLVGLTGRFDEPALFAFLSELEGGTPPLVVEGLTVRSVPAPAGPPLDVSVTLFSFAAGQDAP